MKCVQCKQEIRDGQTIIPMTPGGDMACGLICKSMYEKTHDKFFNDTINNDKKFEDWMNEWSI